MEISCQWIHIRKESVMNFCWFFFFSGDSPPGPELICWTPPLPPTLPQPSTLLFHLHLSSVSPPSPIPAPWFPWRLSSHHSSPLIPFSIFTPRGQNKQRVGSLWLRSKLKMKTSESEASWNPAAQTHRHTHKPTHTTTISSASLSSAVFLFFRLSPKLQTSPCLHVHVNTLYVQVSLTADPESKQASRVSVTHVMNQRWFPHLWEVKTGSSQLLPWQWGDQLADFFILKNKTDYK